VINPGVGALDVSAETLCMLAGVRARWFPPMGVHFWQASLRVRISTGILCADRNAVSDGGEDRVMCRLFAMSGGAREVQATFWLVDAPASLLLQSDAQPNGVGLGTFTQDGTPEVYRKPVAASRSQTFIAGAQRVRSRTFVAHIRLATAGEPLVENTHPFEQHGRLFAHNGIVGDLPELRRRVGSYADLVRGSTDSELYFALITRRIDEAGGDVSAGITAAVQEVARELPLFSLNLVLATPGELWALRYPESRELWILERSLGGFADPGGFGERSVSGMLRVLSADFSILPATVIASERMDTSPDWRLLQSGELLHIDPEQRVTSTIAVAHPPAHLIERSEMNAQEAAAAAFG
jgi:glutamine amidotransferase